MLVICAMCWCQLPKLLLVVAWESAGGGQDLGKSKGLEILSHYGNNRDFIEKSSGQLTSGGTGEYIQGKGQMTNCRFECP